MNDDGSAPPPAESSDGTAAGAGDDGRASQDTLAIVVFALGVASLALSAIPFYGSFLAVPLGLVAVVLGLVARRDADAGRGFATAGLVSGGVALLIAVAWIVTMVFPFWGMRSETSIRAGETAVEHVGSPEQPIGTPDATPGSDGDPGPAEVGPGDPPPPAGALEDATGDVEITLDDEEHHLELSDCTLGEERGHTYLRGSGPDGRLVLRVGAPGVGSAEVLLVVERDAAATQVFVGEQRGFTSGERSTMFDRRRIELVGSLRRALDDEPVGIELVATCS